MATFLEGMGLGKYLQIFKENGFDEIEIVMEMQTKHLIEMKIPAGHQIKIMKRIQALKNEDPESQKKLLADNTKFNSTANTSKTKEEPNSARVSSATISRRLNTEETNDTLMDKVNNSGLGHTDNKTTENWNRNVESASSKKKVRFNEDPSEEQAFRKTGPILKGQSKPPTPSSKHREEVITKEKQEKIPTTVTSGTQAEEGVGTSPRSIKKASCWLCFALVSEDDVVVHKTKQFCSQECLEKYKSSNSVEVIAISNNILDSMCKRIL